MKFASFTRFESAQQALASVPLYPIAKWSAKDDDDAKFTVVKLDLRTKPTVSDSPKFSQFFRKFEHGTPEQWCRWNEDLETVCAGLNLTDAPNQIGMIRHLLGGQARDTFNQHFSDLTGSQKDKETAENIKIGLKKVAVTIFVESAAVNQKQYLRHELKKPNKLTARETASRLQQLNTWLKYYPASGNDATTEVTKLDETEIREIFFRLLPMAWRRKMDENVQFDRTKEGLRGLIEYAERLETSEARFEGKPKENASSKEKSHFGSQKPDGKAKKGKSEAGGAAHRGNGALPTWTKDCLVHGEGCGHPSHRCKVLLDHATKVKGQFKASFKDKNDAKAVHKKAGAAKSWKKNSSDRTFTKKEVQAIVKRANEKFKEKEEEDELDFEMNQIGSFAPDSDSLKDIQMVDSLLEELQID